MPLVRVCLCVCACCGCVQTSVFLCVVFSVDRCKFAHLNEKFIHDVNILYESNVYIFILA